jgi:hypothetical protein
MFRRIVPVLCLAACFGPALQADTALLRESTEPGGRGDMGPPRSKRRRPIGRLVFHMFGALAELETQPDPEAYLSGPRRRVARWPHRRPSAEN